MQERGGSERMTHRVLLVDVDSKIPNLALMKVSESCKERGDIVGFDVTDPDYVFVSVIFKENKEQAIGIKTFYPNAIFIIGGSGYSLESHLDTKTELTKPDYDLYPSTYSQGYTSRGCIRKCGFCIVPEKEGKIRVAQHPREFHDERFDTCMIMDNNLFAAPPRWQEEVFEWFIDNRIKMLSPQGWDIRLLTKRRVEYLRLVKHKESIHFAWDNIEDERDVIKGINLLKEKKFDLKHNISFYVLCGFNTTFEQDLYRVQKLRDLGVQSFVMPYHKKDKRINALARWANRPWLYWSIPFEEYKKARS
jgi:hypothetical protein